MVEVDSIPKLIAQIEELRMERLTRDELIEEKATLRNLIMRMDGLKLILERHEAVLKLPESEPR